MVLYRSEFSHLDFFIDLGDFSLPIKIFSKKTISIEMGINLLLHNDFL